MKNSGHIIRLVVLLFILPLASSAQAPTITTSVNKSRILIGEQIDLSVQVTMPDNHFRLTWLTIPVEFGSFVVASHEKIDTSYSTGILSYRQNLQITSFDSGKQIVPPLEFQFETLSGDSTFKMFTDSVPVDVMFSPADSVLPFHDIKPIIAVKKESSMWYWPAIIAGILLLLLILLLIIRHRKKKRSQNIFESPLSDFDEAMKLIKELREENLPSKEEFKLFYVRLTDILKRYISRSNNENKMHLTGAETIDELSHQDIEREMLNRFASSIRMADAVKFARFKPSEKDCEDCIEHVSEVIKTLNLKKTEVQDDH